MLVDAVARLAGTHTDEQLALLLGLIGDFRDILTAYAATLRAQASNGSPPT